MKSGWCLPFCVAFVLLPLPAGAQGSSAHYVLQQATFNTGGGTSVSPAGTAHRMSDSLGQESVSGCSSSFHYVLQSGFWSFVGSGLVPVVLMLAKDAGDPECPDLSWTGNNQYYFVYRSTSAADTFWNLDHSQPGRTWTDGSPPEGLVVIYNVLATAPGILAVGSQEPRVVQAGDP